jgi:hypothetical protein
MHSYGMSYSSNPGPTFMGQFLMDNITNTHHAQLAIDIELLKGEIVIISQLQVINVQCLRDIDGLAVRWDSTGIHAIQMAECVVIIPEIKLMRNMGLPAWLGGFPIDSLTFKKWQCENRDGSDLAT